MFTNLYSNLCSKLTIETFAGKGWLKYGIWHRVSIIFMLSFENAADRILSIRSRNLQNMV